MRRAIRHLLVPLVAIVIATLLLGATPTRKQPEIKVADWSWARDIDEARHEPMKPFRGKQTGYRSIVLWVKLEGNEEALKWVREHQDRGIEIVWIHYVAGKAVGEAGVTESEPIDVHRGLVENLDALETEVAARGFFDWRTWSIKQNLLPGKWRVKVVAGDRILARKDTGGLCELELTVE